MDSLFPNRPADARVVFWLTSETFDGKVRIVRSGYRPICDICSDYWTSTFHKFIGVSEVKTGEETVADVWFITPEVYPKSLWTGRVLSVSEGARKVGTSTVLEIYNPILDRDRFEQK